VKLFVARHCWAGDSVSDPKKERERPLKPEGIAIATAMAQEMADQDEIPSVVFASPLVRAQQTADIYGKILGLQVSIIDDLAPNRPMDYQLLGLMGAGDLRRFMVLGHHDNATPAFNSFGGKMAKEKRPDDDQIRTDLGYRDSSTPGDNNDNPKAKGDWVPLVMGEVRRLRIDRVTGKWKVKWRLRPSDIGMRDY
jgi:phosphohistidine phosphatase SixA